MSPAIDFAIDFVRTRLRLCDRPIGRSVDPRTDTRHRDDGEEPHVPRSFGFNSALAAIYAARTFPSVIASILEQTESGRAKRRDERGREEEREREKVEGGAKNCPV